MRGLLVGTVVVSGGLGGSGSLGSLACLDALDQHDDAQDRQNGQHNIEDDEEYDIVADAFDELMDSEEYDELFGDEDDE